MSVALCCSCCRSASAAAFIAAISFLYWCVCKDVNLHITLRKNAHQPDSRYSRDIDSIHPSAAPFIAAASLLYQRVSKDVTMHINVTVDIQIGYMLPPHISSLLPSFSTGVCKDVNKHINITADLYANETCTYMLALHPASPRKTLRERQRRGELTGRKTTFPL